jgi:hypothetical protein
MSAPHASLAATRTWANAGDPAIPESIEDSMKMVVITVAALTFGCGGSTGDREVPAPGGNPAGTAQAPGAGATARATEQVIELVGCLQGPAPAPQAAGTSGTRGPTSGRPGEDATGVNAARASGARFTLVDAAAASTSGAGIGANGAGGSGGPLVSGRSAYDLDGIPADAAAHVNKQVRVTGRMDPDVAPIGGGNSGRSGESSDRTSSRVDHQTPSPPARGNDRGIPAPAGGRSGPSSGAPGGATTESANRRVVVESIQVVSESCASR